jgi:MFS family permease
VLRSVLAVVAGYLLIFFATILTDVALGFLAPDAFPAAGEGFASVPWMVVILVYSTIFAALGGYVTARIARRAELKHGLVLAAIMVLMSAGTMMAYAGRHPLWFQLTLLVLGPLAVLAGAWLHTQRRQRVAAPA